MNVIAALLLLGLIFLPLVAASPSPSETADYDFHVTEIHLWDVYENGGSLSGVKIRRW